MIFSVRILHDSRFRSSPSLILLPSLIDPSKPHHNPKPPALHFHFLLPDYSPVAFVFIILDQTNFAKELHTYWEATSQAPFSMGGIEDDAAEGTLASNPMQMDETPSTEPMTREETSQGEMPPFEPLRRLVLLSAASSSTMLRCSFEMRYLH